MLDSDWQQILHCSAHFCISLPCFSACSVSHLVLNQQLVKTLIGSLKKSYNMHTVNVENGSQEYVTYSIYFDNAVVYLKIPTMSAYSSSLSMDVCSLYYILVYVLLLPIGSLLTNSSEQSNDDKVAMTSLASMAVGRSRKGATLSTANDNISMERKKRRARSLDFFREVREFIWKNHLDQYSLTVYTSLRPSCPVKIDESECSDVSGPESNLDDNECLFCSNTEILISIGRSVVSSVNVDVSNLCYEKFRCRQRMQSECKSAGELLRVDERLISSLESSLRLTLGTVLHPVHIKDCEYFVLDAVDGSPSPSSGAAFVKCTVNVTPNQDVTGTVAPTAITAAATIHALATAIYEQCCEALDCSTVTLTMEAYCVYSGSDPSTTGTVFIGPLEENNPSPLIIRLQEASQEFLAFDLLHSILLGITDDECDVDQDQALVSAAVEEDEDVYHQNILNDTYVVDKFEYVFNFENIVMVQQCIAQLPCTLIAEHYMDVVLETECFVVSSAAKKQSAVKYSSDGRCVARVSNSSSLPPYNDGIMTKIDIAGSMFGFSSEQYDSPIAIFEKCLQQHLGVTRLGDVFYRGVSDSLAIPSTGAQLPAVRCWVLVTVNYFAGQQRGQLSSNSDTAANTTVVQMHVLSAFVKFVICGVDKISISHQSLVHKNLLRRLQKCCLETNQNILLDDMNTSRIANPFLLSLSASTGGGIAVGNGPLPYLPGTTDRSTDTANISVDNESVTPLAISPEDDIMDKLNYNDMLTTIQQSDGECTSRWNSYRFGCFQCPRQYTVHLSFEDAIVLTYDTTLNNLKSCLGLFSISNYHNGFVSKDAFNNVFYMKFMVSRENSSQKALMLGIYGSCKPDVRMCNELRNMLQAKLVELSAKAVSLMLSRNASLQASYLDFVKQSEGTRHATVSYLLPPFVNDVYYFCSITKQLFLYSQILSIVTVSGADTTHNTGSNASPTSRAQGKVGGIAFSGSRSTSRALLSEMVKSEDVTSPPVNASTNAAVVPASTALHQRVLVRQQHVDVEGHGRDTIIDDQDAPIDEEVTDSSPFTLDVDTPPLDEETLSDEDPPKQQERSEETMSVLWNQNEFTFSYNCLAGNAPSSTSSAASPATMQSSKPAPPLTVNTSSTTSTALTTSAKVLNKVVGQGLALVEFGPHEPSIVSSIKDAKEIADTNIDSSDSTHICSPAATQVVLTPGARIHMLKDVTALMEYLTSVTASSNFSFTKWNTQAEATTPATTPSATSTKGRQGVPFEAHSTYAVHDNEQGPASDVAGVNTSNATAISLPGVTLKVFPTVPMQTSSLVEICTTLLDQSLVIYSVERLFFSMAEEVSPSAETKSLKKNITAALIEAEISDDLPRHSLSSVDSGNVPDQVNTEENVAILTESVEIEQLAGQNEERIIDVDNNEEQEDVYAVIPFTISQTHVDCMRSLLSNCKQAEYSAQLLKKGTPSNVSDVICGSGQRHFSFSVSLTEKHVADLHSSLTLNVAEAFPALSSLIVTPTIDQSLDGSDPAHANRMNRLCLHSSIYSDVVSAIDQNIDAMEEQFASDNAETLENSDRKYDQSPGKPPIVGNISHSRDRERSSSNPPYPLLDPSRSRSISNTTPIAVTDIRLIVDNDALSVPASAPSTAQTVQSQQIHTTPSVDNRANSLQQPRSLRCRHYYLEIKVTTEGVTLYYYNIQPTHIAKLIEICRERVTVANKAQQESEIQNLIRLGVLPPRILSRSITQKTVSGAVSSDLAVSNGSSQKMAAFTINDAVIVMRQLQRLWWSRKVIARLSTLDIGRGGNGEKDVCDRGQSPKPPVPTVLDVDHLDSMECLLKIPCDAWRKGVEISKMNIPLLTTVTTSTETADSSRDRVRNAEQVACLAYLERMKAWCYMSDVDFLMYRQDVNPVGSDRNLPFMFGTPFIGIFTLFPIPDSSAIIVTELRQQSCGIEETTKANDTVEGDGDAADVDCNEVEENVVYIEVTHRMIDLVTLLESENVRCCDFYNGCKKALLISPELNKLMSKLGVASKVLPLHSPILMARVQEHPLILGYYQSFVWEAYNFTADIITDKNSECNGSVPFEGSYDLNICHIFRLLSELFSCYNKDMFTVREMSLLDFLCGLSASSDVEIGESHIPSAGEDGRSEEEFSCDQSLGVVEDQKVSIAGVDDVGTDVSIENTASEVNTGNEHVAGTSSSSAKSSGVKSREAHDAMAKQLKLDQCDFSTILNIINCAHTSAVDSSNSHSFEAIELLHVKTCPLPKAEHIPDGSSGDDVTNGQKVKLFCCHFAVCASTAAHTLYEGILLVHGSGDSNVQDLQIMIVNTCPPPKPAAQESHTVATPLLSTGNLSANSHLTQSSKSNVDADSLLWLSPLPTPTDQQYPGVDSIARGAALWSMMQCAALNSVVPKIALVMTNNIGNTIGSSSGNCHISAELLVLLRQHVFLILQRTSNFFLLDRSWSILSEAHKINEAANPIYLSTIGMIIQQCNRIALTFLEFLMLPCISFYACFPPCVLNELGQPNKLSVLYDFLKMSFRSVLYFTTTIPRDSPVASSEHDTNSTAPHHVPRWNDNYVILGEGHFAIHIIINQRGASFFLLENFLLYEQSRLTGGTGTYVKQAQENLCNEVVRCILHALSVLPLKEIR